MADILGLANEFHIWPGGSSPALTTFQLNQTTDAIEAIFQAEEDATITRLGFRQSSIVGTAPFYRISLQSVDGSGVPTGTILGGGSPASNVFQPVSGNNAKWVWQTLDNSIAITRGTRYAIVINYSSGTIDASNAVTLVITSAIGASLGSPYMIQNDGGTRARQSPSPVFGYGSSGVAYGMPVEAVITSAYNSGSTPDEKGNLFNFPTTWWSTYKIVGVTLYGTLAAGTTYTLNLYDTDGTTVLQTISLDTDHDQSTGSAKARMLLFDESSLATLNSGSSYRLAIAPDTATSITLVGATMNAAADLDAYVGGANVAQGTTRTNAGAWADDNLTRYGLNPILANITAPSGGGGGGNPFHGPF